MKKILIVLFASSGLAVWGQSYSLSGTVLDAKTQEPVEFATLWLEGSGLGTMTDSHGKFVIGHVPEGKYELFVRCLGYSAYDLPLSVKKDEKDLLIHLSGQTLALDEVTVTAERKTTAAATSYTLGRTALDHLQSLSVADALSLLPGEQTSRFKNLTSAGQTVTLRGEKAEMGNPGFGTVVEMDGVRLSGNATATATGGTDTRQIGHSNVERIEVITGVPSVEYGDLTNGVVRIITRKGKSPLVAEVAVRPDTRSYALSKGIGLGKEAGVLNLAFERVRSVSDIASPYTSYVRNAFSLKYSNSLHTKAGKAFSAELSLNGNVGGSDTKADPDAFKETYARSRDNSLWSSLTFHYMANSPWLASLRGGLTFSYAGKRAEEKRNQSASSVQPALHTTEEGYFVASRYEDDPSSPILLLPTGYWYTTSVNDSRPVNYSAFLKARWNHRTGSVSGSLLAGTEMKGDGNLGRGTSYKDLSAAPTWREYRYDALPFMHNLAAYAEEEITVAFRRSQLLLKGGLRSDVTFIPGSAYGTVSSLSPRFSAKYSFGRKEQGFFRGATLRAGWGKAVKLPSFEMLYPRETYVDRLTFAPGAMADGTTYYAYHTQPVLPVYNPELRWQYNLMREVGMDIRLKGVNISLSFFYNTLSDPYTSTRVYTPFDYKLTAQSALNGCPIPSAHRQYAVDRVTGVVTVSDKTGALPSQTLPYKVMHDFRSAVMHVNGSSSSRTGLEWVLDFDRIQAIGTSIRIDGKYYRYKGIDEVTVPSTTGLTGTDGQPYKYIGYYVGGNHTYNGFTTRRLNTNLTLVTHVPRIRMIFSLRFESTLLHTRQNLSEYSGGVRSLAIASQGDNLLSDGRTDIYGGAGYVATYPQYYVSREDMETRIPFMEKFLWAATHDKDLYNELSKLVAKSATGYLFRKQAYSPYFSANLNVTKEIGDRLTVSFFANNFFYSLQKVRNRQTGNRESLLTAALVTPFNYGISFKLKL